MKRVLFVFVFYVVILLIIPYMIVSVSIPKPNKEESTVAEPMEKITSYIHSSGEVIEFDFGEYLKGVVGAEMPASFNEEALKAQAVAARSYILARAKHYKENSAPAEHNGAITCDDPAHCKAFSSKQTLEKQWGENFEKYWDKISACVDETKGVVMTYDGEIANAVFHSTSSGYTENAKDVWGGDVAYLVSVKSEGDYLSPKYDGELAISIKEYKEKISEKYPQAKWEEGKELIENIERSDAGAIISITTGNVTMKGSEFRLLFSLRSANVEFFYDEIAITMRTKGNGHGVGMSQYGANYLASQGQGYEQILKTYYSGVDVGVYTGQI